MVFNAFTFLFAVISVQAYCSGEYLKRSSVYDQRENGGYGEVSPVGHGRGGHSQHGQQSGYKGELMHGVGGQERNSYEGGNMHGSNIGGRGGHREGSGSRYRGGGHSFSDRGGNSHGDGFGSGSLHRNNHAETGKTLKQRGSHGGQGYNVGGGGGYGEIVTGYGGGGKGHISGHETGMVGYGHGNNKKSITDINAAAILAIQQIKELDRAASYSFSGGGGGYGRK